MRTSLSAVPAPRESIRTPGSAKSAGPSWARLAGLVALGVRRAFVVHGVRVALRPFLRVLLVVHLLLLLETNIYREENMSNQSHANKLPAVQCGSMESITESYT